MPRQARIDLPGMVYHIMARGIEQRAIFMDDQDRNDFLKRLQQSLEKTPSQILAWALMPNHFHLLIRAGPEGIARLMRRLMSGYANYFNLRHRRVGHLFQNRYKSLLCNEDEYLLQLVRYIHLNPLKGGFVKDIQTLEEYPYSGHSAVMEKVHRKWQASKEILGYFGKNFQEAREKYKLFIKDGLANMTETGVLGGGYQQLTQENHRSLSRRESDRELRDSQVLGDGIFTALVWDQQQKKENLLHQIERKGIKLRQIVRHVAEVLEISERRLFERGRLAKISKGKALIIYIGVEVFGKSVKEMARITRMSVPAASKARERGALLFHKPEWKKINKLIS